MLDYTKITNTNAGQCAQCAQVCVVGSYSGLPSFQMVTAKLTAVYPKGSSSEFHRIQKSSVMTGSNQKEKEHNCLG